MLAEFKRIDGIVLTSTPQYLPPPSKSAAIAAKDECAYERPLKNGELLVWSPCGKMKNQSGLLSA
jgi:hypothetical protein